MDQASSEGFRRIWAGPKRIKIERGIDMTLKSIIESILDCSEVEVKEKCSEVESKWARHFSWDSFLIPSPPDLAQQREDDVKEKSIRTQIILQGTGFYIFLISATFFLQFVFVVVLWPPMGMPV